MTLCLAALATPFACLYDLSALTLALAVEGGAAFAWFWIFSSLYLFVSVFSVSPGAPGLALLLWLLWRSRKSNQQSLTAMTRLPHALEPAQARESERLLFVNQK